jgi:DNA-binding MarR family transcriptional regulator
MMSFNINNCVNYITAASIKKVSKAYNSWLMPYGITRIQWTALYYISKQNEISQRELSTVMGIEDSSGMRLVERLERDGFVKRTRSHTDKRVIVVSLSKKGTATMAQLLPLGEEFSQVLINGISEQELDIFINIMNRMESNILSDSRSQTDI